MIENRLNSLKKKFNLLKIDGYVVPKNDEFFSEYSQKDRLRTISNFSGSAGYAVILKNKNILFVDGRYTIQAHIESGKYFKIEKLEKILNCKLFKGLTLGIDPKIFTQGQMKKFFLKYNKIKIINTNLIDNIFNKYKINSKPFFSLNQKITGESYKKRIIKISKILKKHKSDYLLVTAPENVAWLLNIRGYDNPNSPIPNCRLILTKNKKIFLISEKFKVTKLIREKKILKDEVFETESFERLINKLKSGKIIIDKKTCSIYLDKLLQKKFRILNKEDPIYLLKSIKNKNEIKHMIDSHIIDGVALTKFLHWIKVLNKKKISEIDAQNKLEKFRKMNKNYLFPSFDTISGAGGNGAIVHYRASKKTSKNINKNDIFLCDSGGQYKYGTTDVTRTICFSKPKKKSKIFLQKY